ncbi:MAG TPA: hypothetical protein DCZ76_08160 [Treponema sp.]|nr:hypothetical protein [Treponema sp.]
MLLGKEDAKISPWLDTALQGALRSLHSQRSVKWLVEGNSFQKDCFKKALGWRPATGLRKIFALI